MPNQGLEGSAQQHPLLGSLLATLVGAPSAPALGCRDQQTSVSNSPSICYLCGRPLAPPLSQDHVPAKQFHADAVRYQHSLNLRTITVHKECNLADQFDEDYFVNTIAPFARGSYSGNALLHEVFQKYRSEKKRGLVSKAERAS